MDKLTFRQAFQGSFPAVFVVSQDDTQVLLDLKGVFEARVASARKKKQQIKINAKVHNLSWGTRSLDESIGVWNSPIDTPDPNSIALSRALSALYSGASPGGGSPSSPASEEKGVDFVAEFLIILDCDHHFDPRNQDVQVVRRIKNILELSARNDRNNRFLVFVGKSATIPQAISDMVVVVDSDPPTETELSPVVKMLTMATGLATDPQVLLKNFEGMAIPQVKQTFRHQLVLTKKGDPFDMSVFRKMKEETLKTSGGLVNLIQPSSSETFDALGGMTRYKDWAKLVKPAWSEEGRAYGLEPPKGVLLTGVYGCGKSQSVKGLAQLWGLPILQFEMGKLRSGLIGSSEKNLYSSLKIIEGFGDCIVWVDEAEKSLSGSASSNTTDGGVGLRMLGIFSTWMQETKNRVCFVMTANGVSSLPPEFVNRLDERFFFDIPSGQDMIDVISLLIQRNGWDPKSYSVYELSVAADRLVPREIEQTLKHARMLAFSQGLPAPTQEILSSALKAKTRILDTMEKQVQEIRDWVGYDPERDEGRNAKLAASRRTTFSGSKGKSLFKEL